MSTEQTVQALSEALDDERVRPIARLSSALEGDSAHLHPVSDRVAASARNLRAQSIGVAPIMTITPRLRRVLPSPNLSWARAGIDTRAT